MLGGNTPALTLLAPDRRAWARATSLSPTSKYRLHKSTNQAIVSIHGERVYLGPYGSPESHVEYQKILKQWQVERDRQSASKAAEKKHAADDVASVTTTTLRQKRLVGSPITIDELVLVYRRHTHQYYRKNGEITREATIIDDAKAAFPRFIESRFSPMTCEIYRRPS